MSPTPPADDLESTDRFPALEPPPAEAAEELSLADTGPWAVGAGPFGDPAAGADERVAQLQAELELRDGTIANLAARVAAAEHAAAEARRATAEAVQARDVVHAEFTRLREELRARDLQIEVLRAQVHELSGGGVAPAAPPPEPGPINAFGPTPGAACWLVRVDDGTHRVYSVQGPTCSIGRTPDNELQVAESYISRRHAVLRIGAGVFVVEDAGSTNGVFVNGLRVQGEALRDGDLLAFGKARFRFHTRDSGA